MSDTIYEIGVMFLSLVYVGALLGVFLGDSLGKIARETPTTSRTCKLLMSFSDYFWCNDLWLPMGVSWPLIFLWHYMLVILVIAMGIYGFYQGLLGLVQRLP